MFSKKIFCKGNISKNVRPLLAALSVNRLSIRYGPLTMIGYWHTLDRITRVLLIMSCFVWTEHQSVQLDVIVEKKPGICVSSV